MFSVRVFERAHKKQVGLDIFQVGGRIPACKACSSPSSQGDKKEERKKKKKKLACKDKGGKGGE